jgi:peptidoglycan/LPS O-acetylase OafA/YrhL
MPLPKNTEHTIDVGRSEFIQAMRFVAATLVLVTHSTFYYHERVNHDFSLWPSGAIGVEIFFVISGIVMVLCTATLPFNSTGAKIFFTRRLLRIVPLYWLVLILKVSITLILPSVVRHNHFDLLHTIKSFLFIPVFNAEGDIRPIHGVGWTLQHEMFFYIVFASVMLLGARPARWASIVIFGFIVLGYTVPFQSAFMQVVTNPINLYFIVGMIIGSTFIHGGMQHQASHILLAGLLFLALLKLVFLKSMEIIPLAPVVLISGALMLLLAVRRIPSPLRFTIALGDSSYALYLFHPLIAPPVLLIVHRIGAPLGALAEISLTVLITVALAHGIHKRLELPLNQLIKRMFRRRPHTSQVTP